MTALSISPRPSTLAYDILGVERCDECRCFVPQTNAVAVVKNDVPAILCRRCASHVARHAPAPDFGCALPSRMAARS